MLITDNTCWHMYLLCCQDSFRESFDCLLSFQAGPHKPAAFFPQWPNRMSLFISICICSGTWPIRVDLCLYMLRRHIGVEVQLHLKTPAKDESVWLTLRPNCFIPEKGLGTQWVGPKPVWKFWRREKSLVLTGIRTPDCEASHHTTPLATLLLSLDGLGSNYAPENRLHLLKVFVVFLRPFRQVFWCCDPSIYKIHRSKCQKSTLNSANNASFQILSCSLFTDIHPFDDMHPAVLCIVKQTLNLLVFGSRFEVPTAVLIKVPVLWHRRRTNWRARTIIFERHADSNWTLEDWTHRLSQNFGKKLPLLAA